MLGSSIFEIAIGLAFVFFLLSLVCSAVQEGLASWLKCRASDLEKGKAAAIWHDRARRQGGRMLENVQQATIKPLIKALVVVGTLGNTDEHDIYARLDQ